MASPDWYKKLTDFPSNKENPFLDQTVAELKVSIKRQTIRPRKGSGGENNLLVVDSLGEQHASAVFVREIEVDEGQFTKLYREGLPAISGLSTRGTKVFGYICHQLEPGKTTIHFMLSQCMEFTGYKSRANVLSGLGELLAAEIIARSTESSLYFINPIVMFNGNRLTFAKTYIKKKLSAKDSNQLVLGFTTFDKLRELEQKS
jgi:hypothetical protein